MTSFRMARKTVLEQNDHLKAYQRKKLMSFFIKLFVIEAIIVLFSLYLKNYTKIALVLGGVLAMLLPCWILKPQQFFGKCGLGRISEVANVSKRVARQNGVVVFYTDMHYRTFVVCRVELPNGRTLEYEYDKCYEPAFFKEDTLLVLPGIKHPINLTKHDWVVCPFCGNVMPCENEECISCGAKAIRVEKT